jgi:hypothetical protein
MALTEQGGNAETSDDKTAALLCSSKGSTGSLFKVDDSCTNLAKKLEKSCYLQ